MFCLCEAINIFKHFLNLNGEAEHTLAIPLSIINEYYRWVSRKLYSIRILQTCMRVRKIRRDNTTVKLTVAFFTESNNKTVYMHF
jgi:hypothetical protein